MRLQRIASGAYNSRGPEDLPGESRWPEFTVARLRGRWVVMNRDTKIGAARRRDEAFAIVADACGEPVEHDGGRNSRGPIVGP